ncbi:GAF and ANTAR domain-containing protein [Actinoplanes oblitus]|uniref:GAF and ANTAR domain-containing protein n=1 Tax=Actinoplanes oblitus TaxID=3040509 RepID=A0ABY8W402_9ACTN|nr:GAF and ANTAR domain-containing protein [Actinoplanes oblitus]WIM92561.1 GAF and ANTAR domain-containing protein [Actinoplanes oblitus]
MTSVSSERLAAIFVEIADTLVAEFEVLEFLTMLADRAVTLVDAAAVGVLLADQGGELAFLAASDESARLVEVFQVQAQEGPCLEAFRTGRPVVNVDLDTAAGLWPGFAPRAAAAGFRSVHAFPLRLRSDVIGALNVFGTHPGGDVSGTDIPVMQALADIATIGLLQQRTIHRGEVLAGQLQDALDSRVAIEQAKGVVAQARGISVDDAFTAIRAYARNRNLRLAEVARTVVTSRSAIPGLTGPPSGRRR